MQADAKAKTQATGQAEEAVSAQELGAAFAEMDADQDGAVDLDEFVAWYSNTALGLGP